MSTSKGGLRARWFNGWRRAPQRQPDFADFGTAFGLELSLSQLPEDEALPSAPQPLPAARSWRQRLRQRRGG